MPRKTDSRRLKKSMLIIVEGETELIYFNQLKSDQHLSNLTIQPKIAPRKDPLNIVKRAKLENNRKEFDYTWCIFDLDSIRANDERYESALSMAKKNGYYLAESFPCFEIWFLLHYVYATKYYSSCKQLIRELCKYINDYCKEQKYLHQKNLFRMLKDKLPTAIENCKKMEAYNSVEEIKNGTKCDIYKIIEEIYRILI